MKRARKPWGPPVDLAAARKRAAEKDACVADAAKWLTHVRSQARMLLAAGAAPSLEVARLLRNIAPYAMHAASAVLDALPVDEAERGEAERIADCLMSDSAVACGYRELVEEKAAKGSRPEQLALEMVRVRR